MVAKNTIMIGPKKAAIPAVPRLCTRNSRIRITIVAGSTKGARFGDICLRPSSAESTEIAGVMIASPENSADPATPMKKMSSVRLPSARWASAISDRMPPSPLLSACIRNSTYLAVTVTISAQTISETTPITSNGAMPPSLMWLRQV